MKKFLIPFLFGLSVFFSQAQDKSGSEDHPLVPRFKQARIYDYEVKSFEPMAISTSKVTKYDELDESIKVEGKLYRIWYDLPSSMGSTYEIYTNFKNAFSGENAEVLFTCYGKKECGKYFWNAMGSTNTYLMSSYLGEEIAYHAARFEKDGMLYTLAITVGYGLGEQGYEVHLVESKIMEQSITTDGIAASMRKSGKVALDGILFDTGSATLKASSMEVVSQLADYLLKNPEVKIYVVGHTDNVGSYESNVALSLRRAESVCSTLSRKHNISKKRLHAAGVGPVSPEASNTTDPGRKKNRRVEAVLQ